MLNILIIIVLGSCFVAYARRLDRTPMDVSNGIGRYPTFGARLRCKDGVSVGQNTREFQTKRRLCNWKNQDWPFVRVYNDPDYR